MPLNVEEQSTENNPFVIPLMCCHEYVRRYVSSIQVDYTQGTLSLRIQFVEAQVTNDATLLHVPIPKANRLHQNQHKIHMPTNFDLTDPKSLPLSTNLFVN